MTFQQLNLSEPILRALKAEGYVTPTPIQQQAIPVVLQKKDLLGCAQTGTGKTAAFALPLLQLLDADRWNSKGYKHIRALILTPTRELALQIHESFCTYGRNMGLKTDVIFGGVSQHTQTISLRNGTDILVATPGRLLDLMNQGHVHLAHLQFFVLDEADRMLDMGFINDIKKVIRELPEERQTLFFSATMPPEIAKLANSLLHDPVKIEVTPVSSTVEKIEQSVYFVDRQNKSALLVHLLKQQANKRTLIFTRTKHGADKIAKHLGAANIRAGVLHGNKSQEQRQRALNNFKTGRLEVMVATDIAARGIDIDDITHVINYDLPNVPETYVHRIGRTGRAGNAGIAISFCDREERIFLRDINKVTNQLIPAVTEHPFKPVVIEQQRSFQPKRNFNNNKRRINSARA
ncbi:MAG TPA: DEAD/DEAH box helicase [Chitinophagaceae bacterium]|nr:DEAD/DEAH box helicase [Chitinophagaceae bacterium]